MTAKTWIELSATALRHNLRSVRRFVGPAQVMAVVKSNAYGHGLPEVAQLCVEEKVDWFGVDRVEEAFALRAIGCSQPILVLGYANAEAAAMAVARDISLTAYSVEMVRAAAKAATKKHPARLHVKLETGLHRQGVEGAQLEAVLRQAKRSKNVVLEGLSTHFANIEDTENPSYAKKQLARFLAARGMVERTGFEPTWQHSACSAAAFLYPETRFNLIRLGISLYGIWSSELTRAAMSVKAISLKPVLAWKAAIAQVKLVKAGEPVSYGLTERMKKDGKIAVLPIGYYDGFDRVAMSSKGEVLIRGERCKVIGRVCMNMCMVDVSGVAGAKTGDEVVLIGKQKKQEVTAEEFAGRCDTIPYEILARLNPSIPKRLV